MFQNPIGLETLLLVLGQILAFAIACRLARYPEKAFKGILLGVVAGLLVSFVASAVIGFAGHLIPFGQIDFWLAGLFAKT